MNIAYGYEGASDEVVHGVTKAARADHFIRTLPLGYDTVISEEMDSLSQGQRQIITIARAILSTISNLYNSQFASNLSATA